MCGLDRVKRCGCSLASQDLCQHCGLRYSEKSEQVLVPLDPEKYSITFGHGFILLLEKHEHG